MASEAVSRKLFRQAVLMKRTLHSRGVAAPLIVAASATALAFCVLASGIVSLAEFGAAAHRESREPGNGPQLVSIEPLSPDMDGQMCEWAPASASATLAESLAAGSSAPALSEDTPPLGGTVDADRPPLRVIKDPYPSYSAVAVEPKSNMLVMTDENIFRILEYNRQDNTPPGAQLTEPKRIIGGDKTKAEMMCGVYIDPVSGDIYAVNNDTQDWLVIFSRNARGNTEPDRALAVPHGTFGIAVDEKRRELYLTAQHTNQVIVYPKMASGHDQPLRSLYGDSTQLEDPHGVAVDSTNNLMFVTNHGSVRYRGRTPQLAVGISNYTPGSGQFHAPSIAVYARDASGNTAPLRTISGPKTTLNWPMLIAVDEQRAEIYVANDMDNSVVVFRESDEGNVAPARIIKGPKTGVKNPTGVALDLANQELWVANMGNHSASVFPLTANGNIQPLRTIRGGPGNELSLMIGNPGAVGYDTKRDQILVPN
jgi:DNA-binding beta-propeller fold protein YncE